MLHCLAPLDITVEPRYTNSYCNCNCSCNSNTTQRWEGRTV